MARMHHIYSFATEKFVEEIPYIANDPNHGLPLSFFDGHLLTFIVDEEADTVEWVPECGPAPCWEVKYSKVKHDLWGEWDKWAAENY